MTYQEFAQARQFLAEVGVGRLLQEHQSQEDAAYEAAKRALGG